MRLSIFLLLCVLLPLGSFETEARPPNVILILADDLGPGDLGAYGQTRIQTPHLNRLAAEGMKLTRHYCGNAVCAPSRSVLMTGLHPGHTPIRDNRGVSKAEVKTKGGMPTLEGQHPLPEATVTLPEILRDLGYATGGFGKWGLGGPKSTGAPLNQGFQRWFGYLCQSVAHNFYPIYLWDDAQTIPLKNPDFPAHDQFRPDEDPKNPESYRRFQGQEYSPDLIAEQALAFIRQHRDQPFFLYWPTTVPHVALQVPDDSLKDYQGQWEDPPYPGGRGYLPHFHPKAAYAAMITRMDREVGRTMALVKELGLEEDTLFVFLSDNGPLNGTHQGLAGTDCAFFNSNQGLRDGKGTLYEGGIRSPGILRWPGKIEPGSSSACLSGFEDWLPTLVELAGGKERLPAGLDGISLMPLMMGKPSTPRDFLYREFPGYGGQVCVISGRWKLIQTGLSGKKVRGKTIPPSTELYDLSVDEKETQNLAAKHPDIVAELEAILASQHQPSPDFPFPALDRR